MDMKDHFLFLKVYSQHPLKKNNRRGRVILPSKLNSIVKNLASNLEGEKKKGERNGILLVDRL